MGALRLASAAVLAAFVVLPATAERKVYGLAEAKSYLQTLPDKPGSARAFLVDPPEKSRLEVCLEEWKRDLRDPRASYVVGGMEQLMMSKKDAKAPRVFRRTLVVDIRTPNAAGGMEPMLIACDYNEDLSRFKPGTDWYRFGIKYSTVAEMVELDGPKKKK